MKTEQAKHTLATLIVQAIERDRAGDVVGRQQHLRTIEDLPLSDKYVRAELDRVGLLGVYKG